MKYLLVLLLLVVRVNAGEVLVLDHDFLWSLAKTKEPGVRIDYTLERVEFRTRRSILVGWASVLLTARFERHGDRVQLTAQSLRAGSIEQRGRRFLEAKAGLLNLVDVQTPARFVAIHDGNLVHKFTVLEPDTIEAEEASTRDAAPLQVPQHTTRPARMPGHP